MSVYMRPFFLTEWTDFDGAAFTLGACIGLWSDTRDEYLKNKEIFWSDNPLGRALHLLLEELCERGDLEKNEDDEYKTAYISLEDFKRQLAEDNK